MSRMSERGSAMLVTMIIVTALLAGAAVLVSMQVASNRSTDLVRTGMSATYCAEAGLSAARPIVAANYLQWKTALAACTTGAPDTPCTEPAWLYSGIGSHDIDADGFDDFRVYIKDNDDEQNPSVNDPGNDSDLRVFIVSKCIKYADTQKEVEELIEYSGGGQIYKSQAGYGAQGTGNRN